MTRLLISGFGPFGGHAVNASGEVVRRIWEEGLDGVDLVRIELPTSRAVASGLLLDAFDKVRPDVTVMFGIAETRSVITPERIAVNIDDYRIPDIDGLQLVDEPIVAGGPAAYFSTLPIKRMVRALVAEGIPAGVSNSAGTYLCNHVSYALLDHIERSGAPCRAGFVHIPQMAEAVADGAPSLPFATLVRGAMVALEAVFGKG